MRLIRFGPKGKEQPGIEIEDRIVRSEAIEDLPDLRLEVLPGARRRRLVTGAQALAGQSFRVITRHGPVPRRRRLEEPLPEIEQIVHHVPVAVGVEEAAQEAGHHVGTAALAASAKEGF